ncbi:MAG TPA: PEGA domain-containing protein [Gemmatimonadales bacterium]|nr:PEGA domain-containing protein [Gemmatimonadales bacterium]
MRRIGRVILLTLGGGVLVGLAACATIMQGSSQEVSVASTPTGAKVLVDGNEVGKTPYVAKLSRKDKHVVRIEMEGYQPFELPLARATSGWVWGNIVFGGIPGLAIDAITGGMYKLKPEQIEATLAANTASVRRDHDVLVVAVVLHPDPSWQRIGSLQRVR